MSSSPRSFSLSSLAENHTVNIVLSEWYRTALTSENAYTRGNSSSQDFMNYILDSRALESGMEERLEVDTGCEKHS